MCKYAEFACIAVLGACSTGVTYDTNDVAALKMFVLVFEGLSGGCICLAEDLDVDTLRADLVEDELLA